MKKHIPNILTILRIILSPIIVLSAILGNPITTGILIAATAATDLFDGVLARKFNAITPLGALLDQIADKIFSLVTIIAIAITSTPLVLVNLVGELTISTVNIKAKQKGLKTDSSKLGKLKTWVLSLNSLLTYLSSIVPILKPLILTSTLITAGMQTLTTVDYINKYKKEEQNNEKTNVKNKEENHEELEIVNQNDREKDISYLKHYKDIMTSRHDEKVKNLQKKIEN